MIKLRQIIQQKLDYIQFNSQKIMYDNTSKAVAFIINSDNEVYYE